MVALWYVSAAVKTVDAAQIRELAALSRLSLADAEADAFSEQLAKILGYVEQLQAVDVRGVPEYLPPSTLGSALRADVASEPMRVSEALEPAAAKRNHQVLVPKFKED